MDPHPKKHPNTFVTLYLKYRCKDTNQNLIAIYVPIEAQSF